MPISTSVITGTVQHSHSLASAEGGYLSEGVTGITGGNIGEVLTATASDIPVWSSPASSAVWTAQGTASASSVQSQLEVTGISGDPDIVQILFSVDGDTPLQHLALRINDIQTSTYNSRVIGLYNAFDYDGFSNKTEFWVDRETNNENRCGCIWLFKPNSNLSNVGWTFRADDTETGLTPSYITISGGANSSITSAMTSVQMLFDVGDILGNIQVNSMTYQ